MKISRLCDGSQIAVQVLLVGAPAPLSPEQSLDTPTHSKFGVGLAAADYQKRIKEAAGSPPGSHNVKCGNTRVLTSTMLHRSTMELKLEEFNEISYVTLMVGCQWKCSAEPRALTSKLIRV